MTTRIATAIAAVAASALLLAGCSPATETPSGSTPPSTSDLTGSITVYSPGAGEYGAVVEAFNKEYPGITVNMVRLVGQELTTRIQSEVTSGQHVADVVLSSTAGSGGPWVPDSVDWYEPYLPAAAADLAPEFVNKDDGWFMPFSAIFGLAYNADAIDESDAPGSWDALLDPEWKGRIVISDPTVPNLTTVAFAGLMADGVIDEQWVTELAAQSPTISETPQIGQALSDGTGDVGVWGQGFTVNAVAAGAPLKTDHALDILAPYGVALLAGAPDPDAAKVFIDWLLTPASQELWAELGNVGSVEGGSLPDGVADDVRTNAPIVPPFPEAAPLMGRVAAAWKAAQG